MSLQFQENVAIQLFYISRSVDDYIIVNISKKVFILKYNSDGNKCKLNIKINEKRVNFIT